MLQDALNRNESCGGHFRVESQTEEERFEMMKLLCIGVGI